MSSVFKGFGIGRRSVVSLGLKRSVIISSIFGLPEGFSFRQRRIRGRNLMLFTDATC